MQERSIKKCKVCMQLKVRILDRKIGKDKIWVSEDGKAWNGNTCSDCHIVICRVHIKVKRSKNEKV